jgi:Calcineurin-like phosphoesterase
MSERRWLMSPPKKPKYRCTASFVHPLTWPRSFRHLDLNGVKVGVTTAMQPKASQPEQPLGAAPTVNASGSAESATPSRAQEKRMVGWYDPRQLAQTAVQVAISTIFGRHSDRRLVEALASGEVNEKFYDYTCHYTDDGQDHCEPDRTHPRDSIWIDYVGDVGDGWNSTYAIACELAKTGLTFTYKDREKGECQAETNRGDILIFGGDEAYPTASRKEYNERLLGPYETALRYSSDPHRHVFAIPGNHDWYDSLVTFTRFFTSRRWFAGWRTRQSRSYFALKLPHNWWLLGTDVQLGSDIDGPQVVYFQSLGKEMRAESEKTGKPASVILCHAEPHWIRAAQYAGMDPNYSESNLRLLEKRLGKDVAVFLAGDLHHYRRHEARDRSTQKITAGGGGAFLHPTHVGLLGRKLDTIVERGLDQQREGSQSEKRSLGEKPIEPRQDRRFELKACFPPEEVSRRLCWRNLIFPYLKGNASWTFGFVTAVLYLLTTLSVVARIDDVKIQTVQFTLGSITGTAIYTLINSPATLFFVTVTVLGFVFFTDTHSLPYRIIMGSIHALAHVLAAFTIALLCVSFVASISTPDGWRLPIPWGGGYQFHLDTRMLLASSIILIGGYVVGAFIMGLYLLISMNVFGRHSNEAFSSLAIQDWKNFLRLHIDNTGNLTIYPIGIKRVPRRWEPHGAGETGPELISKDRRATGPALIEPPIVMEKARTGTGTGARTRAGGSEAHTQP